MNVSPVTPDPVNPPVEGVQRVEPVPVGFGTILGRISGPNVPTHTSHTVKAGESLWQICRDQLAANGNAPTGSEVYTAVLAVAKANRLANPDVLGIGQLLDMSALRSTTPPATVPAHTSPLIPTQPAAPTLLKSSAPTHVVSNAEAPRSTTRYVPAARHDGVGGVALSGNFFAQLVGHSSGAAQAARSRVELTKADKPVDVSTLMQSILEPGSVPAEKPAAGTAFAGLLGGPAEISSTFGMRHNPMGRGFEFHSGIDLAADTGTKIYPYKAGTVHYTGWEPGLGRVVVVDHGGGFETVYGHTSESLVKAGQQVTPGTAIAKVGSTGRSTGPHLHFEVRQDGKPIDPLPLLRGNPLLHVAKAL